MRNKNLKIKKLFLIFFLSVSVLCPLSFNRTNSGFALVENNIFADTSNGDSEKSDSQKKDKKEVKQDNLADPKEEPKLFQYKEQQVEEASTASLFVRFFVIIILLLTGFYFFYRFVTKKTGFLSVGRGAVDILSAVPVGPNKYIQIVDIAGKIMVLGVTDSNISLITEVTDRDEKDRIRLESSKSVPMQNANFAKYFSDSISYMTDVVKKVTNEKKKKNVIKNQSRTPSSLNEDEFEDYLNSEKLNYLKEQKERLKKLNGSHDE